MPDVRRKDPLPDESIQATMADIEQEIAFHHECIVALRQIRAGYERILGIRREERERVAAQAATGTTEAVAAAALSLAQDVLTMPAVLEGIVPTVASQWEWEPLKPHARQRVTVTAVKWNGEDVWIESEDRSGQRGWNELSRWVEATVLVEPLLEPS